MASYEQQTPQKQQFRAQFKKTQLCHFFLAKKCTRGDRCDFAHGGDDVTTRPDLTKTSICNAWSKRLCKLSSDQCPFAHGKSELRATCTPPKKQPLRNKPDLSTLAMPEKLNLNSAVSDSMPQDPFALSGLNFRNIRAGNNGQVEQPNDAISICRDPGKLSNHELPLAGAKQGIMFVPAMVVAWPGLMSQGVETDHQGDAPTFQCAPYNAYIAPDESQWISTQGRWQPRATMAEDTNAKMFTTFSDRVQEARPSADHSQVERPVLPVGPVPRANEETGMKFDIDRLCSVLKAAMPDHYED